MAWRCHRRHRLVVAANRDEFHARPATGLAPWDDTPGIIAGRDLQAGGTWLGVDPRGRFGSVTNFREFGRSRRAAPSRGGLVPAYLSSPQAPGEFLRSLETDAPGYAGFNLLLADGDSLWYASNRADVFARPLEPGIYGLSNEFLDTPWPKLVRVRAAFRTLLESADGDDTSALTAGLLAVLADREPAPPGELQPGDLSAEWARKLSAPFVLDPVYGTRSSTVLTIAHSGTLTITERRFAADGTTAAEAERALNVAR